MESIKKITNIESFETLRLKARKVEKGDYDAVLSIYQHPVVMATIGGVVHEVDAKTRFQGCLDAWAQNGFDAWLWYEKDSHKLIGRGGMHKREINGEQAVAVGYVLFPEFWNKGYATEIVSACSDIAFEVVLLDKLYCSVEHTNKPSLRVIEKNGFKFLGDIHYVGEMHLLYSLERQAKSPKPQS